MIIENRNKNVAKPRRGERIIASELLNNHVTPSGL